MTDAVRTECSLFHLASRVAVCVLTKENVDRRWVIDNEAQVTITRQTTWNDAGMATGSKEQWHISGFIQAASQSALTTALAALKSGYGVHGLNIGLYLDNGTLTNHFLTSALCEGGTRVMDGPTFPEGSCARQRESARRVGE